MDPRLKLYCGTDPLCENIPRQIVILECENYLVYMYKKKKTKETTVDVTNRRDRKYGDVFVK